jgi:hypothetical protein
MHVGLTILIDRASRRDSLLSLHLLWQHSQLSWGGFWQEFTVLLRKEHRWLWSSDMRSFPLQNGISGVGIRRVSSLEELFTETLTSTHRCACACNLAAADPVWMRKLQQPVETRAGCQLTRHIPCSRCRGTTRHSTSGDLSRTSRMQSSRVLAAMFWDGRNAWARDTVRRSWRT